MTETPPVPVESLFGASVSPGLFSPVPVVSIAGADIASGAAGPDDSLMVVDGLSITWGRDDVLDQPTPSTGRLTLFDATRTWATTADRRGQRVTVRYEGTDPLEGPRSAVFFRGRIGAPITVSRRTVVHPVTGEKITGSLVDMPLVSVLVEPANITPTIDWPAESLGTRLDRIIVDLQTKGYMVYGSFSMRSYWSTPTVAPVAAKDQVSLLEHLMAVYDSSGMDRMIYVPDTDSIRPLVRRDYVTQRGLAGLWWDATDPARARHGQGVYVRSMAAAPADGFAGDPAYLDAHALEYDPGDGLTMPSRITRVSITHPDQAAATPYSNVTAEQKVTSLTVGGGAINEELFGVRSAHVDSLVAWNNYADTALSDLAELVRKEGSAWVLQPLVWTTRKTGGFETAAQARALLSGCQTDTLLFLQRSWLPQYGVRPVYGVMGGTIAYSQAGWDLEFSVAPVTTSQPQHAITWEEIDDGSSTYQVEWWDDDHPRGMHESLTFEDLGYCATGLGVSTVAPDTGWDQ